MPCSCSRMYCFLFCEDLQCLRSLHSKSANWFSLIGILGKTSTAAKQGKSKNVVKAAKLVFVAQFELQT